MVFNLLFMPTSELFQGILGRFEVSVVYIIIISSNVDIFLRCIHLNCFKEYWAVLRFLLFTY